MWKWYDGYLDGYNDGYHSHKDGYWRIPSYVMRNIPTDGYVRRVISDGYALAKPHNFLQDGYVYDVFRDNVLITSGQAVRVGPIYQVLLTPLTPATSLAGIHKNDYIKRRT